MSATTNNSESPRLAGRGLPIANTLEGNPLMTAMLHPNIAAPDTFAGFEVRLEYCDRRREALPCVTGGLLRPECLIWLYPNEGYFRVRVYTHGMSAADLSRIETEARALPEGGFAAIRHWRECPSRVAIRYTQTRGRLIDFDFDRLELELAVDRSIEGEVAYPALELT